MELYGSTTDDASWGHKERMSDLALKLARLARNGTNHGLLRLYFSTFGPASQSELLCDHIMTSITHVKIVSCLIILVINFLKT